MLAEQSRQKQEQETLDAWMKAQLKMEEHRLQMKREERQELMQVIGRLFNVMSQLPSFQHDNVYFNVKVYFCCHRVKPYIHPPFESGESHITNDFSVVYMCVWYRYIQILLLNKSLYLVRFWLPTGEEKKSLYQDIQEQG